MGLLDFLFKSRATRNGKRPVETRGESGEPLPDPTIFLVPRERAPLVMPAPSPPRIEPPRRDTPSIPSARQIVITFGEVLARIPPEFLSEAAPDPRRELRFSPGEFFADIPRGRVTVALSNIARQYPEAFRAPIADADDREVRLPLQRLLDQLVGVSAPRATGGPPVPHATRAPKPPAAAIEAAPPIAAPAAPEPAESHLRLSLAAILTGCPDEVFTSARPTVEEAVQVALPLETIEAQLPTGVVAISAERFLSLLPPFLAARIPLRAGARLPLPIEEIFRNLPGSGAYPVQPTAHPRMTPPPPLLVHPIGENGHTDLLTAPTTEHATPFTALPAEATPPGLAFERPPQARPFVVLPPPLAIAAEHPPETTSDQTAVLEYLARGDEAQPPK
jgi:hypothetical protein